MAVCYDAVDEVKGPVACKKKDLRSYEIVYMTKEAKPFILFYPSSRLVKFYSISLNFWISPPEIHQIDRDKGFSLKISMLYIYIHGPQIRMKKSGIRVDTQTNSSKVSISKGLQSCPSSLHWARLSSAEINDHMSPTLCYMV